MTTQFSCLTPTDAEKYNASVGKIETQCSLWRQISRISMRRVFMLVVAAAGGCMITMAAQAHAGPPRGGHAASKTSHATHRAASHAPAKTASKTSHAVNHAAKHAPAKTAHTAHPAAKTTAGRTTGHTAHKPATAGHTVSHRPTAGTTGKTTPHTKPHTPSKAGGNHGGYHLKHGHKFGHGYSYRGRHHPHWRYHYWDARYGAYLYYDGDLGVYYYYSQPDDSYYPVSYVPYGTYVSDMTDYSDAPMPPADCVAPPPVSLATATPAC